MGASNVMTIARNRGTIQSRDRETVEEAYYKTGVVSQRFWLRRCMKFDWTSGTIRRSSHFMVILDSRSGNDYACFLFVILVCLGVGLAPINRAVGATTFPDVHVEEEENVYTFTSANNGAGPMWCSGSTCLVRIGDRLFASGLEMLQNAQPLNNCRWLLFERNSDGWHPIAADPSGRTREPCPLTGFPDGQVFLSANPTLVEDPDAYAGSAQPEILRFSATNPEGGFEKWIPQWEGSPEFTEHSYRSFAADGSRKEMILFQNIGYTHAEWTFRDSTGSWAAQGKLKWPWGAEYENPQPVRICYPNVALKNRSVYFCGVSDILEPNPKWREFKYELTGRKWDYDFRRLFFTWSSDITTGEFNGWVEIASREETAGWISPGDLYVDPEGIVHLVWAERAIDVRLREKFFPNKKQSHQLNYARIKGNQVIERHTLARADEGVSQIIPAAPRFHVTPGLRLFVLYYASGTDSSGNAVSENRLMELRPDSSYPPPFLRVPLKHPMNRFFTATVRAGCEPSDVIDLLGVRAGVGNTISYARVRLTGASVENKVAP